MPPYNVAGKCGKEITHDRLRKKPPHHFVIPSEARNLSFF